MNAFFSRLMRSFKSWLKSPNGKALCLLALCLILAVWLLRETRDSSESSFSKSDWMFFAQIVTSLGAALAWRDMEVFANRVEPKRDFDSGGPITAIGHIADRKTRIWLYHLGTYALLVLATVVFADFKNKGWLSTPAEYAIISVTTAFTLVLQTAALQCLMRNQQEWARLREAQQRPVAERSAA